jgi:hypothetical protein
MAINLNEYFTSAAQDNPNAGVESALQQYDQNAFQAGFGQSLDNTDDYFKISPLSRTLGEQNLSRAPISSFSQNRDAELTVYDDPMMNFQKTGDITRKESDRFGRSLIAGLGQVAQQTGDLFTFLQSLNPQSKYYLPFNDPIGDFFREPGQELMSKFGNTYVPEELKDFSWSDLGNPVLWTGDIAQQIPNIIGFYQIGSAGARMGTSWMKRHAVSQLKKGKGTKYGAALTGVKGTEVISKGKGVLGLPSLFLRTGKEAAQLSRLGGAVGGLAGAGFTTTVLDGGMLAGQEYRMAIDMGLTPDQAAEAAAGTWLDNFKWLGINMLSWGITFGRIPRMLTPGFLKVGAEGGKTFGKRAARLAYSVGTRAPLEALEETFQESYQEWAQKKNLAKVQGEVYKYGGVNGFLDYYNSPENARTRLVAAGAGLIGGGGGAFINSIANRQFDIDQQEERIKRGDVQEMGEQMESVIISAVENDMSQMLVDYIEERVEQDGLTRAQADQIVETINFVQDTYNTIPDFMSEVTSSGKARILEAKLIIEKNKNAIKFKEEQLEQYKEDKKDAQESQEYKDNLAIQEKSLQEFKEKVDEQNSKLQREILQIEKAALNEIEAFEKARPDAGDVGQLSKEQQEAYIQREADKVAPKEEEQEDSPGIVESIVKGVKQVGKTVKETVTGKTQEEEAASEEDGKDSIAKQWKEAFERGDKKRMKELEESADGKEAGKTFFENLKEEVEKGEQVVVDDSAAQELVTELETKKPAAVKSNPKFKQVLSKIANKIVGGQDTLSDAEQRIQDEFADELDVEITKVQESKKKVETEESQESEEQTVVEDDESVEPKSKTKSDPKKAKVKPKQETKEKEDEQINDLQDKYNVRSISGFSVVQEKLGVPIALLDTLTNPYGASMAMEMSGAIFVTPNALYQEQIVHELTGHVYFRANYDTPLIQSFINKIIKSNEFALLKAQYPELSMYNWFGNEMTLHEIVGDIISRSTDARSRFRDIEAINEARRKQGKPLLKRGPASELNQRIVEKALEYYESWNNGDYNTVQGQAKLISDSKELTDLFTQGKIGNVLPDVDQKGLQEEAWATYISDPGSNQADAKAKDIFANLFTDPKENKQRERTAKRFWNIVSKQGKKIQEPATEILKMSMPELEGMTLSEMKEQLRTANLSVTPEQLRDRRVTQSRVQMAKRKTAFTKAYTTYNAITNEVTNNVISEYNKKGSEIRKAIESGNLTRDLLKPLVIQASNKYGKDNPFYAYKSVDKFDNIIDGIIRNTVRSVNTQLPGANISQAVSKETLEALKKSANALMEDLGVETEEQIDELVKAGMTISQDLTMQIWGIDSSDEIEMQDHAAALRNEVEPGSSSDNTLGIYNKERDELITTISAMMLDFERSFLSTKSGSKLKQSRLESKTPFMKDRSVGVLSELLILAQNSTSAQDFAKRVKGHRQAGVRAFYEYLQNKFGSAPKLVMAANMKQKLAEQGSTDIYTDYFLGNVWVNLKSKTHENIFSTVVSDQAQRENNTLEMYNEADQAFEEKSLIDFVLKIQFNKFTSLSEDNPAKPYQNLESLRYRYIAEAERIKANIDNDVDVDHNADIIELFNSMFNNEANGYFIFNTLYKSGVNFKGKNYHLTDWFAKEGYKHFRRATNRVSVRSFKDLLSQVAINSRAHHYFTMLHNAENNPTNTMNTRSFVLDQRDRMNEMFKLQEGETLDEYNERILEEGKFYDFIQQKNGKLLHNQFMPFELKDGKFVPKQVRLSFRGGLITELRNRGLNYTRLTPQELMVSDMTDFFNAVNKKKVYRQSVSVFAEKTRMYYVDVMPMSTAKLNKEILPWLEQYENRTYKDSEVKILPGIKNGKFDNAVVKKEVDLIKAHILNYKHLYVKNTAFKGFFNANGELTAKADKQLTNYVQNYIVNSFASQRMFIGNQEQFKSENDFTVRAAGAIARKTTPDSNKILDVSILPTDESEDGQGYMLAEDLAMDSAEFGLNLMRDESSTAKHLKYVYYGQDMRSYEDRLQNDLFVPGSSMYLKGNVIAITDKMAKLSPHLRLVRLHLQQRKEHLKDVGKGNIRVVAYNGSAVKAFPGDMNAYTIDLTSDRQSRMDILDGMYFNNPEAKTEYRGLDGNNFGVQLPLDKEKQSAIMASQSYAQHLTNVTSDDASIMADLKAAHRSFARSMEEQSKETAVRRYYDISSYNDRQQTIMNQKLLASIHESWAGTPTSNLAEYVSPFFPKVNMVRNAILNKMLIETGTKIQAPGTVAFQMTDKGMNLKSHTKLSELDYVNKNDLQIFGGDLVVSEVIVPRSMMVGFGGRYKRGDVLLASRIPSHGKASQPVLIIKDNFDEAAGSVIAIPSEISKIMGSDLDGDALFVNGRHTGKLKKSQRFYNQAFEDIVKVLGNEKFLTNETQKAINPDEAADAALTEVKRIYGENYEQAIESSMMMPMGRMMAFNENVPAGGMIGIAAVMQRDLNYFSHYNAELKFDIAINGLEKNRFTDQNNELGYFQTALVLNIILDNPKHQTARKLGFTYQTIKPAMLMLRMGYSLADVSAILNSRAAKKYNKYASERTVIYNDDKSYYTPGLKAILEYQNPGVTNSIEFINNKSRLQPFSRSTEYKKANKALQVKSGESISVDTEGLANNITEVNIEVIRLLDTLNKVGTEAFNAGRIIGAYGLTLQNGFEVDKLINDFNDVGTTKESLFKQGTLDRYRQDSIVRQNLKVLEKVKTLDRITNIQYSSENIAVQDAMNEYVMPEMSNLFQKSPTNVRNYQLFRMRNELSVLSDMPSKDVLYAQIKSLVENEYLKPLEKRNKFLTSGIRLYDDTKTVSLNTRFFDAFISRNDIIAIQKDFANLDNAASDFAPETITENEVIKNVGNNRKLFIQMDFLQNGWIGGSSTSVAWSPDVYTTEFNINDELANLLADNDRNVSKQEAEKLAVEFLELYPYSAPKITTLEEVNGRYRDKGTSNFVISNLQKEGKVHVVKQFNEGSKQYEVFVYDPATRLYTYKGETKFISTNMVNNDKTDKVVDYKQRSKMSIQDRMFAIEQLRKNNNLKNAKVKFVGDVKAGRAINPAEFAQAPLSEDNYFKLKGITPFMRKKKANAPDVAVFYQRQYESYVADHESAFAYYKEHIETDNYKNFTEARLTEDALLFGEMDKVVHDNIMEFIGIELAERIEAEQIKNIAEVAEKNGISLVNKDLGAWESWLISNNLHQTNADVQALVNRLERDYQKFSTEWRRSAIQIKALADRVKKDKLKDLSSLQVAKLFVQGKLDTYLWGGLVKRVKGRNGKYYVKLRTEDELGRILQSERDFYNVFKGVIQKYYPDANETMVPHKSIGGFQSLMRQGLYGLFKSNVGSTADIDHVKVKAKMPDGSTAVLKYMVWENIYKNSKNMVEGASNIIKLNDIRKDAERLLQRGVDGNNDPIISGTFERKAFQESDAFFNFMDSKQVGLGQLGSMNLEEILLSTLHSNLYKYGYRRYSDQYQKDVPLNNNGVREMDYNQWAMMNGINDFLGMQINLPLIDGAIHLNKIRGNKEMVKYLTEVWKDNVIGGKKQKRSYDWALNKLVDLTTIGLLGLKPGIALGNVLIGKYQALRSKGGKQFLKGEERFWKGFLGGESVLNRVGRIGKEKSLSKTLGRNKTAAILNELMKFEFYQYEDASSTSQQNPLFRIALFPLDQGEKWIQGAMFLGMMTDKQYAAYDVGANGELVVVDEKNALTPEQVRKMVYEVKKQQGFGYSPIDQRRMGVYSFTRFLGQFKRYFWTLGRERGGPVTIDMYGNPDIGSYRAAVEFTQDLYNGKKTMKDFDKLPQFRKDAIMRYLSGVSIAMLAILLYGLTADSDDDDYIQASINNQTKHFLRDQNVFFNPDKLMFMAKPPAVGYVQDKLGIN